MKTVDVMTREVIAAGPDDPVREIAQTMLARRISGVPVIDAQRRVLGIVSEGDLIRRPELGTDAPRRGWLGVFVSEEDRAREFVKSHGRCARDVMTQPAICVGPATPLEEVVRLMERHGIKRLPVVEHGALVGLVTRADLLRALLERRAVSALRRGDKELRGRISAVLAAEDWATSAYVHVEVEDGVVGLWGTVQSEAQREAILLAVRDVEGVNEVQAHLGRSLPG